MTDSRDDRLADDLIGAGDGETSLSEVLADDAVPRHVVEAALAHAFASRPEDADAALVPDLAETPGDAPDDAPDDALDDEHDDVLDGHAAAADGWAGEHALSTEAPAPDDGDDGAEPAAGGGDHDDGG